MSWIDFENHENEYLTAASTIQRQISDICVIAREQLDLEHGQNMWLKGYLSDAKALYLDAYKNNEVFEAPNIATESDILDFYFQKIYGKNILKFSDEILINKVTSLLKDNNFIKEYIKDLPLDIIPSAYLSIHNLLNMHRSDLPEMSDDIFELVGPAIDHKVIKSKVLPSFTLVEDMEKNGCQVIRKIVATDLFSNIRYILISSNEFYHSQNIKNIRVAVDEIIASALKLCHEGYTIHGYFRD